MTVFVLIVLVALGGTAWLINSKSKEPSLLQVNSKTYEELRNRSLIDEDTQTAYGEGCKSYLDREDGSFKRASNICSCTYEAIAQVALANNQSFSSVMGSGKLESLECYIVDR